MALSDETKEEVLQMFERFPEEHVVEIVRKFYEEQNHVLVKSGHSRVDLEVVLRPVSDAERVRIDPHQDDDTQLFLRAVR